MLKFCKNCAGSGKVMGGGMMTTDCKACSGDGKYEPVQPDKRSKTYKEAIDKLMKLDEKLTRDEAVKIFDEEYDKRE